VFSLPWRRRRGAAALDARREAGRQAAALYFELERARSEIRSRIAAVESLERRRELLLVLACDPGSDERGA